MADTSSGSHDRQHSRIATTSPWRRTAVSLIAVVAFLAGMGVDRFALTETAVWGAARIGNLQDLDAFTVLQETYEIIREYYVLSDDISDTDLIYGAARGMVEALGDEGHSRFMDPEETQRYVEAQQGSYVGIGISVDTTVNPPRVVMPYQDTPAFNAGIRQGDVILAIDGAPAAAFTDMTAFTNLIGGEEGTDVVIQLRHLGDTDPYTVTITRARIDLNPVSWAILPNGILWVRLQTFQTGASAGLKLALQYGIDHNARGVIVDLRANPGGLETETIAVGSQFAGDGTVLYKIQDAAGNIDEVTVHGDDGLWLNGPVVVLVDHDSASASEVFASGIQDNRRGTLIGQTTFGTGTVIQQRPISDGSSLMIGIELWLSPDGNVIWHRGVAPDIEIANPPTALISLPYTFDDQTVTAEQLDSLQDAQLLAAIDEIEHLADGGGN